MCQLIFDEEYKYWISKQYLNKFWTDGRTDKPKAICPFNFSKVGGIMTTGVMHVSFLFLFGSAPAAEEKSAGVVVYFAIWL